MYNNIEVINDDCTGCSVCNNVCRTNAIRMQENTEGFYYPRIDKLRCLNCGICLKYCPINNYNRNDTCAVKSFAAYSKKYTHDDNDLSSSGAVYRCIGEWILQQDGCIFAVKEVSNCNYEYCCIEKEDDLLKSQGAKYLQVRFECFNKLEDKLRENRFVLIVGTPCQIAGIRSLIGSKGNVIYLDFVCHGIPSAYVYSKYLETIGFPTSINFRDKTTGWKNYSISSSVNGIKRYSLHTENSFILGMVNNLFLRKSCSNCNFKLQHSKADITIGDLWGAENLINDTNEDRGVSYVSIHTNVGQQVFDEIEGELFTKHINNSEAVEYNPCIEKSITHHKRRDIFFEMLQNSHDLNTLVNRLLQPTLLETVYDFLKKCLRRINIIIENR